MAAGSGITAAWFELLDRAQTDGQRKKTREWYGRKWVTINELGLSDLPERCIQWLLDLLSRLQKITTLARNRISRKYVVLCICALGIVSIINQVDAIISFSLFMLTLGVYAIFMGVISYISVIFLPESSGRKLVAFSYLTILPLFLVLFSGFLVPILAFNIFLATLYTLLLFPLLPIFFDRLIIPNTEAAFHLAQIDHSHFFNIVWLISVSISFSFFFTLLSLSLGSLFVPTSYIPKTMQMLTSNVFFDGLTVFITVSILQIAVGPRNKISIPFAIFIDILLASVFAFLSLWLALYGTDRHLSVSQVLNVFIARTPNGSAFEIGPLFWVMHTTFLPTFFYLAFIFLCWSGKIVVLPIGNLFQRGRAVEKPHHLTAGVFLFLVAIFLGLSSLIGHFNDNEKATKASANISTLTYCSDSRAFANVRQTINNYQNIGYLFPK